MYQETRQRHPRAWRLFEKRIVLHAHARCRSSRFKRDAVEPKAGDMVASATTKQLAQCLRVSQDIFRKVAGLAKAAASAHVCALWLSFSCV